MLSTLEASVIIGMVVAPAVIELEEVIRPWFL
jgi:hypothetical protein